MKRPRGRLLLPIIAIAGLTALSLGAIPPTATAAGFGYNQLNPIQKRHVSGLLATELNRNDVGNNARKLQPSTKRAARQRVTSTGCPGSFGHDVKVNQNCLNITDADLQGRGQAQNETWGAADPNNA
ncbi:MAG: exo-alpha-sialidase, partial [Sciscionella sp.]